MVTILHATLKDIPVIRSIAEETWWPTYGPILSIEQIRFMLDTIYADKELEKHIRTGSQIFILLHDENGPQGFASYSLRPDDATVCKLHKLYVLPGNHGKGYGKLLINEVKLRAINLNASALDLNVNRQNPAIKFYEKAGFIKLREEDVPIGPYWMNDYVMRLTL
ncbi:MAG TPA: GNAT family N-acetyltransferase [Chryseosolibacter sp.]